MTKKIYTTITIILIAGLLGWFGYFIYTKNQEANQAAKELQELSEPILGQVPPDAAVDDKRGMTNTKDQKSPDKATNNPSISKNLSNVKSNKALTSSSLKNPSKKTNQVPSKVTYSLVNLDGVRLNIPSNYQYRQEDQIIFVYNSAGKMLGSIESTPNYFFGDTIQSQLDALGLSEEVSSSSIGFIAGRRAILYSASGSKRAVIPTKTNIYFTTGILSDPNSKILNKVN